MVDNSLQEILSVQIPPDYDGKMIKDFIRNKLGISRGLLRKIVGVNGVLVNGSSAFITSRLQVGDQLSLFSPLEWSEEILPQSIPFDIMYEDTDLLVVNKQAGLIVHPTKGHYTDTLANGVVAHWLKNGEVSRFRPVHRLDKDTSGLLMIGKNHFTHQKLSEQLVKRKVRREYLAIVHGNLESDFFTIQAPILKQKDDPRRRIVSEGGQPATTHVKVETRFKDATFVRLRLETGRTHQIRVHMQYIGHPLFGDELYGMGVSDGINRQALHAEWLGVYHPRQKVWMEWKAPLPEDLQILLENLQKKDLH